MNRKGIISSILICFNIFTTVLTAPAVFSKSIDFNSSYDDYDQYHKVLFSEDFDNAFRVDKRADLWKTGSASLTTESRDNGKALKMQEENGKRLYLNSTVLAPDSDEPTEAEAYPLQKLRFSVDLKLDENAPVQIRCTTYQDNDDFVLLYLYDGRIYTDSLRADAVGTYDFGEWNTFEIFTDSISGCVTAIMNGNITLYENKLFNQLSNKIINAVSSFGIYGTVNTGSNYGNDAKYIYIDNFNISTANAEPEIEINGEQTGVVNYTLLPSVADNGTLIAALYEDDAPVSVKIFPIGNSKKLSVNYSFDFDGILKLFCWDGMSELTPITLDKEIRPIKSADFTAIKDYWKQTVVTSISDEKIKEVSRTVEGYIDNDLIKPNASIRAYFGNDAVDTTEKMGLQYKQLHYMALAYGIDSPYNTYYHNEDVKKYVLEGIEFLNNNLYGAGEEFIRDCNITGRTSWRSLDEYNWFEWFSEVPDYLMDILIIMEDELTDELINNYLAPYEYLTKWMQTEESYNGRESRVKNSILLAAFKNDAKLLRKCVKDLENTLPIVKKGDGYREDGMFIFHTHHPYTGLYGINTLEGSVIPALMLLGSIGLVNKSSVSHIVDYIRNTYEPVIYNGRMMSMLMGRERGNTEESYGAVQAVRAATAIYELCTDYDKAYLNKFMRNIIPADTNTENYFISTMESNKEQEILRSALSGNAKQEYTSCKVYYTGDRVVQLRGGYAIGLSMSSERIANYESINNANKDGWFTGDGMLYVYTDGSYKNQYTKEYWKNTDMMKLAGTTEDIRPREAVSIKNTYEYMPKQDFVGGVEYDNKYAVAAMDFNAFSNDENIDVSNVGYGGKQPTFIADLKAKKSWFMFDNEVICLGAGITSSKDEQVNTYLLNYMFEGDSPLTEGNGWFAVDGFGGYYLPTGVTPVFSTSDSFLYAYISHGTNPNNASYEYAILPNMSSADVEGYAANPHFEILSNTADVQAVKENSLGLEGYVFHKATEFNGITVNAPIVLMVGTEGNKVIVKASDPTQKLKYAVVKVDGETLTFDFEGSKGKTLTKTYSK